MNQYTIVDEAAEFNNFYITSESIAIQFLMARADSFKIPKKEDKMLERIMMNY